MSLLNISLIAGLFFLSGTARASEPKSPVDGRSVLTVSASIDHYPYSYRDKTGHLTGYAVDLLDAVAEILNVKLQRYEFTPEKDLINLSKGTYDISQFHAPIPGRNNLGEFSQPVLINYGAIFVRKGTDPIRTVEELKIKRLKVAGASQAYDYLINHGLDRTRVRMGTSPDCLRWLANGDVDVVVLTRLTGLAQAYHMGLENIGITGAALKDLKVTYCIATRKGDLELIGQINEALATLSTTGKTVEIYSKWFGRYEAKGLSFQQILLIVLGSLCLALVVALWALRRQHQLRHRISLQAAEIQESEEILAEAQSFAHLGHWRFYENGPGLWSPETYRIFERDPSLGPPSAEELVNYATPSDRERYRKALLAFSEKHVNYELDLAIEPKPGLIKYIHERGRPILDSAGNPVGGFGTVQDVTAMRIAETSLRKSEQLLSALYTNLPLGLGVVEKSEHGWSIVSINPMAVKYLGLSSNPSAGCSLSESGLPTERQRQWEDFFEKCSGASDPLGIETSSGDHRTIHSITMVSLGTMDGRPRCFFLIEDVTEKRKQDAEMAQGRRLRAIGELTGGIAHEFNNLLTPIVISSEALLTECAGNHELCAQIEVIANSARRSSELTKRLLSFGRKADHRMDAVDVNQVIEANLQLVQHTIDRRIEIHASTPHALPSILVDANELHQIVLNLLVNARDTLVEKLHHKDSGSWHPEIKIDSEFLPPEAATPIDPAKLPADMDGWIRITVRDNGCGISHPVLERLFEPFYTTKEIGKGSGLGLATTWHLIVNFGGQIHVDSVYGEGSAFHVFVPAVPAQKIAAPQETVRLKKLDGVSHHLLMVEDEPAVAGVIKRMLNKRKHSVIHAENGNAAWELIESGGHAFDAIIMDLNMPGMNGLELARRMRESRFSIPLIVMSGKITEEEQTELACLHIDAIISKPFSMQQLEAVIAKALPKG
jgi:two-component system, cell cycle sensor histidine kinase and response regulator CckA